MRSGFDPYEYPGWVIGQDRDGRWHAVRTKRLTARQRERGWHVFLHAETYDDLMASIAAQDVSASQWG